MNDKNLFLDKIKSELFSADIEKIMAEHYAFQPPGSYEPKHIWQEKARKGLMDALSGRSAQDKFASGFNALISDLKMHVSALEMEKMAKEWADGAANWKGLSPDTRADCLAELLGVSEETLIHFYQSANRYMNAKDFQKSSDAFFVLATLDPRRYNVWLSLGLSDAQLERWNPALMSFSMASLLNMKSPYPYLYSAECCLKNHNPEEAKVYLKLASKAIENETPGTRKKELETVLKNLNNYKK